MFLFLCGFNASNDALFSIWNKFEPRITPRFFFQKLMKIGEFLVQHGEYTTALWQCFDRFLVDYHAQDEAPETSIRTLDELKSAYFARSPDADAAELNSNTVNDDIVCRALIGHCVCKFRFVIGHDAALHNNATTQQVADILAFFRLLMQLLMEREHFCWLVFNSTVYMYQMAHHLMRYGKSLMVSACSTLT